MEVLGQLGMALGLAMAAGFRGFFPVFLVGFVAAYTGQNVPWPFWWLAEPFILVILLFLIVLEVMAERVWGPGYLYSWGHGALQVILGGIAAAVAFFPYSVAFMILGSVVTLWVVLMGGILEEYSWRFLALNREAFRDFMAIFISFLAFLLPGMSLLAITGGIYIAYQWWRELI